MKNLFKIAIFSIFIFMLSSCGDDMSRDSRIKDNIALKSIKTIALLNFSINSDCTIGSGEDVGFVKNVETIKYWGKLHLLSIDSIIKTNKSPTFLDLNKMIKSKEYQNFNLQHSYLTNRIESLPRWISPGKNYINTFEGLGIIKANTTNSKMFCETLKTDAILSIEVTYGLDESFNIPILGNFIKPNWSSFCKVNSDLFNTKGDLVWHYEFKVDSPIKIKANKSLNLVLYSNSSITGKQSDELLKSVELHSSKKIIEALFGDINDL